MRLLSESPHPDRDRQVDGAQLESPGIPHATTQRGGSWPGSAGGGFLFTTFKDEVTPMSEQIYFALSPDGRHWEALNGAEPILISTLGEKGVRDSYLLRSHDGSRFFLLATDLSVHLNPDPDWVRPVRRGSQSLVVWESDDLVHWSQPRLVRVAAEDAGCAWAPEAVYDEEAQDYLVFWASTNASDNFSKHRIWASHTRDFKTFGKPFVYIDKSHHLIDTDIVVDNGKYYRFSKDDKTKAITLERSAHLLGPWEDVSNFSLAALEGYEGPQCFRLHENTWCLLLDFYSRGEGYQPFLTHDLGSGEFSPAAGFSFPFHFRHGSVLPLNVAEYARLQAAFGTDQEPLAP